MWGFPHLTHPTRYRIIISYKLNRWGTMTKSAFYILSFTWGLPTTLAGCAMADLQLLRGRKPKKWGCCLYFEYGERFWGGMSLGIFFFKDKSNSVHIKNHEHGHAVQNCFFGPLMPFAVAIPSFTRYWYREYLSRVRRVSPKTPYDSVWFEAQATRLGTEFVNSISEK